MMPVEPVSRNETSEGEISCVNRRPPQIHWGWLAALVATAMFWAAYGQWCFQAPQPLANSEIRFENAWRHLQNICGDGTPRPTGSPDHQRVKQYLIDQFRQLGYDVQVQKSQPMQVWDQQPIALENLIARLPASTDSTTPERRKILFVTHYDSHPNGGGAGDDGAAVAGMLELARLESQSPPGVHETVFLLTDGEEAGMLGATDWVQQCDWLDTIELAINLEARGTSGPAFLFETSDGNLPLIRAYAGIAQRPTGNSLAYEVYKAMPNNTDFTLLRGAGLRGLNFAFVGDVQNYHTPHDSLANLDPNSLLHHAQTAELLWRHFRDADDLPASGSNAVYFDIASRWLVWWPESWNTAWLLISVSLFVACCFCCRVGSVRDLIFGIVGGVIVVIVMALLVWVLITGFEQQKWFQPFWGRSITVLGSGGALAAFWSIAIIGWALGGSLIECITKDKSLWIAVWGSWTVLTALVVIFLPGASFLFLIPVTISCLSRLAGHYGVRPRVSRKQREQPGWLAENPLFTTWLPCAATWWIWMPVQRALLAGLGYRLPMLYVVLIPLLISPAIPLVTVTSFRSKMTLIGAGATALVLLVVMLHQAG